MVYLSIALAFLGVLAFEAWCRWLNAKLYRREVDGALDLIRGRLDRMDDDAKRMFDNTNKVRDAVLADGDALRTAEQQLKDAVERVGKCELALSIRRQGVA